MEQVENSGDAFKWQWYDAPGARFCAVVTKDGLIDIFKDQDIPGSVKILSVEPGSNYTRFICSSPKGGSLVQWQESFASKSLWDFDSWDLAFDWFQGQLTYDWFQGQTVIEIKLDMFKAFMYREFPDDAGRFDDVDATIGTFV